MKKNNFRRNGNNRKSYLYQRKSVKFDKEFFKLIFGFSGKNGDSCICCRFPTNFYHRADRSWTAVIFLSINTHFTCSE